MLMSGKNWGNPIISHLEVTEGLRKSLVEKKRSGIKPEEKSN